MIHWLHSDDDSRVVFVTLSSRTYPPMFTDSDLGPTTDCFLKYSFLNSCNLIRFTLLSESEVGSFLPAHRRTRQQHFSVIRPQTSVFVTAAARDAGRVQLQKYAANNRPELCWRQRGSSTQHPSNEETYSNHIINPSTKNKTINTKAKKPTKKQTKKSLKDRHSYQIKSFKTICWKSETSVYKTFKNHIYNSLRVNTQTWRKAIK